MTKETNAQYHKKQKIQKEHGVKIKLKRDIYSLSIKKSKEKKQILCLSPEKNI